ncbi:MAG: hypothetical protein ACJA04_001216, partial [Cellvibrionaceae bacterium]
PKYTECCPVPLPISKTELEFFSSGWIRRKIGSELLAQA